MFKFECERACTFRENGETPRLFEPGEKLNINTEDEALKVPPYFVFIGKNEDPRVTAKLKAEEAKAAAEKEATEGDGSKKAGKKTKAEKEAEAAAAAEAKAEAEANGQE